MQFERQVELPYETERLTLRFSTVDDLDDSFAFQGRDDATRYVTFNTRTRDEVRAVLAERETKHRRIENDDDALVISVVERESNRVIGELYFMLKSVEHQHIEIGYIFNPEFQGKGYATEGSRALLEFAFDIYDAHRVTAECDTRNPASYRVMEKLGMRRETHALEDMWFKGEWTDTYAYGILQREWRASRT